MAYRAAWGAVGLVVVAALACVPEPARKANGDGGGIGGTINVNTGGDGGDTGTPTGTAGAVGGDAGSTGVGGDPATGTGGDTTGAAGAAGAAGTGGTTVGGTGGAGGAGGSHTGGAGGAHAGGAGGTAAGGTGGIPAPVSPCDRMSWTFTPSVVCTTNCAGMMDAQKLPSNAIDGDLSTRYTTGIKQGSAGPESVVLSFAAPVTISGIGLYAKATTDAPNMYKVEYSTDGATFLAFAPPVAGAGLTTLLIPFAKTQLRAIRVTQTGVWPHWWSINEMTVVGCSAP
jgi:hypothetical protein